MESFVYENVENGDFYKYLIENSETLSDSEIKELYLERYEREICGHVSILTGSITKLIELEIYESELGIEIYMDEVLSGEEASKEIDIITLNEDSITIKSSYNQKPSTEKEIPYLETLKKER